MALAPADFYKLGSGSNSDERKPRRAPAPGTNRPRRRPRLLQGAILGCIRVIRACWGGRRRCLTVAGRSRFA